MRRIVWITLVFLVLAFPLSARADVAPPSGPPGANPGPADNVTQVRMVAETVLLEVLESAPTGSLGRARVTADFTMRNLGTQPESMAARFPISCNDGFFNYPEIQNLKVWVDGETVATRRFDGPDCHYRDGTAPWAEFDVTFPPGQDVPLRVSYTLDGTGELSLVSFYYLLETGAGWKDTIGSADLIVRLPYAASAQNVLLDGSTGWSSITPGGTFSGSEIHWHFENLEPTARDNLEVAVVRPGYWKAVLSERANVSRDPTDGEAWGRLGKAYKDVITMRRGLRSDASGQELYALSVEAYERALALLPTDALWHAGFADLLAVYAYYTAWEGVDTHAEALRAMQEMQVALELAPRNVRVAEIAEQIYWIFPDAIQTVDGSYAFLWLTATPTPLAATSTPVPEPSSPPSATRVPPTSSPPAAASPSPGAQPASGSRLPCGSAGLAAIPAAVLVAARRRSNARTRDTAT